MSRAAAGALESLENRMMLSAGQPDWSFNLSGLRDILASEMGVYLYAGGDAEAPLLTGPEDLYYGYTTVLSGYTGMKINDVFTDAAGKIIVVGSTKGSHAVSGTRIMPNEGGEFAETNVRVAVYDNDYFVARLNPDGSLDTLNAPPGRDYAFSQGSYPATEDAFNAVPTLYNDWAIAGAINPTNGQIVTIGYGAGGTPIMVRYDQVPTLGHLAPVGGVQPLPGFPGFRYGDMKGMVMQEDGKFYVYGSSYRTTTGYDFIVARYNPDGSLDASFAGGGTWVLNSGSYNADAVLTAAVSPSTINGTANPDAGKLVIAGSTDDTYPNPDSGYSRVVIMRLNADGTIDSTFGVGGKAVLDDFGGKNGEIRDLKFQGDGKLVALGVIDNVSDIAYALDTTFLVRFNASGTIDGTMAGRGFSYISSPALFGSWLGTSFDIESSGKFVVAGVIDGVTFGAVRLTNTGRTDLTYGNLGSAVNPTQVTVVPPAIIDFKADTVTAEGKAPINVSITYPDWATYAATSLSVRSSSHFSFYSLSYSSAINNPDGTYTVNYTIAAPMFLGWRAGNNGTLAVMAQRWDANLGKYSDEIIAGSVLISIPSTSPSAVVYPAIPAYESAAAGYAYFSVLFSPSASGDPLDLASIDQPGIVTVNAEYLSPLSVIDNGDGTYTANFAYFVSSSGTQVIRLTPGLVRDTAVPEPGYVVGGVIGRFDSAIQSTTVAPPDLFNNRGPVVWIQADGKALISYSYLDSFSPSETATLVRFQTDARRPVANLLANDVQKDTDKYYFTVTYTDEVMISGGTVGALAALTDAISILDANGNPVPGTFTISDILYVSNSYDADGDMVNDARVISVRYEFAPTTAWTFLANGSYTIRQNAAAAPTDLDGLSVQGRDLGRFKVDIATPDFTPPTVSFTFPAYVDLNGDLQPAGNDLAAGVSQSGQPSFPFRLLITDMGSGVDMLSLRTGSILITGPGGFSQQATFGSAEPISGTQVIATFILNAPTGTFGVLDNGMYSISIEPGGIADSAEVPNYVTAGVYGAFSVAVGADGMVDQAKPMGALLSAPAIVITKNKFDVVITYTDDQAIKVSTLSIDNIELRLIGSGAILKPYTFVVGQSGNGSPRTVTYSFSPIGPSYTPLNGTYELYINGSSVFDTSGLPANFVPEQKLAQLTINVPADTAKPVAAVLSSPPVTRLGTAYYDFVVRFTDDVAVLRSTIEAIDVTVLGPGNISYVCTLQSITPAGNGEVLDATYRMAAPGGVWTLAANGDYSILIAAGAVSDAAGNLSDAADGGFTVSLDVTGPTAEVMSIDNETSLPAITTATAAPYQFKVRFYDPSGVDPASITANSITIADGNDVPYTVRLVSVDASTDPTTRTAIFEMDYPASSLTGGWNASFNGAYFIKLAPNGVIDVDGNPAPGGDIGDFTVSISATPLTAALVSTPTARAGAATIRFNVVFTGTDFVNYLTLLDNDGVIRVTGPRGYSQMATYIGMDEEANGASRIVTYSVNAPGGAWDFTDNGTYRISAVNGSGAETIAGGTLSAASLGAFSVNFARVVLAGGVVQIHGTDNPDTIQVIKDGTLLKVFFNNDPVVNYTYERVGRILVFGNGGNDTIKIQRTLARSATIEGGSGRDSLQGGAKRDYIYGGTGNDVIYGWGGSDRLYGEAGNDTIYGGGGNDRIDGGDGNDRLYGQDGEDTLIGGAGTNSLVGGTGVDVLA